MVGVSAPVDTVREGRSAVCPRRGRRGGGSAAAAPPSCVRPLLPSSCRQAHTLCEAGRVAPVTRGGHGTGGRERPSVPFPARPASPARPAADAATSRGGMRDREYNGWSGPAGQNPGRKPTGHRRASAREVRSLGEQRSDSQGQYGPGVSALRRRSPRGHRRTSPRCVRPASALGSAERYRLERSRLSAGPCSPPCRTTSRTASSAARR